MKSPDFSNCNNLKTLILGSAAITTLLTLASWLQFKSALNDTISLETIFKPTSQSQTSTGTSFSSFQKPQQLSSSQESNETQVLSSQELSFASSVDIQQRMHKTSVITTSSNENEKDDESITPLGKENPTVYFQPNITFLDDQSVPPPLSILREYISWHSVDALARDTPEQAARRKYIVCEISCPNQAGNQFGFLFNSMVLALVTNRTMLFRYDGHPDSPDSEERCSRILTQASWIPRLEDHRDRVSQGDVAKFSMLNLIRTACNREFGGSSVFICGTGANNLKKSPERIANMGTDIGSNNTALLFRSLSGCPFAKNKTGYEWRMHLNDKLCQDYFGNLFPDELIAHERIDALFSQGIDFLYGMVHRHTVTFTDEFVSTVYTENDIQVDPDAFTIAVHSRHSTIQDDGSNIRDSEKLCINNIVEKYEQAQNASNAKKKFTKCQILIMSDRPNFISAMKEYAQSKGCEGVAVDQNHQRRRLAQIKAEHGAFKGTGYWRDLVLVAKARNGFASTLRSSSMLPLQLVMYDRIMQSWPTHEPEDFTTCYHDS